MISNINCDVLVEDKVEEFEKKIKEIEGKMSLQGNNSGE